MTRGIVRELALEEHQALECLLAPRQLKEALGHSEVCLQVVRVKVDGRVTVPEGGVLVSIPV